MKKMLTMLLCVFALACVAPQAQAALIEDWTYELRTSFEIHYDAQKEVTSSTHDNWQRLSFTSGKNEVTMDTGYKEGILPSSGITSDTIDVGSTRNNSEATKNAYIYDFATWSFSYTVFATEDKSVKTVVDYEIPLRIYYEAATDTTYIFYIKSELPLEDPEKPHSITHAGYTYNFDASIFNAENMNALKAPDDDKDYLGWAITEENSSFFLQTNLSITHTSLIPEPAPTPEPATMLLMGLGLAGLGLVAHRRRNK